MPAINPGPAQNVPSTARVAAGGFGFLIFSHDFDGPDLSGARADIRETHRIEAPANKSLAEIHKTGHSRLI